MVLEVVLVLAFADSKALAIFVVLTEISGLPHSIPRYVVSIVLLVVDVVYMYWPHRAELHAVEAVHFN